MEGVSPTHRISVVGNSGSGKTSLARAIADALGVPYLELDGIYHQPGWTPLPDDEFQRLVSEFVSQDGWVVDGNYSSVADLVWGRADTVVWLDLSRSVVTGRVTRRTLGRLFGRQELWNGNRESWTNLIDLRPERNIILWSLTRHAHYRKKFHEHSRDGTWSGLEVIRLRTVNQESAFLQSLS